jgi:hypothetical protein
MRTRYQPVRVVDNLDIHHSCRASREMRTRYQPVPGGDNVDTHLTMNRSGGSSAIQHSAC